MTITFTIPGTPATKKTSQIPVKSKGRTIIIPAKATRDWTKNAEPWCKRAMRGRPPLEGPIRVGYRFFLSPDQRADLGGLEAAADDAMQKIVYLNDKQICARLFSEKAIDAARPRVEVTVEAVQAQQITIDTEPF